MLQREKIKRRVLWFTLAVASVGLAGTGAYVWRDHRLETRSQASYSEGLVLLADGKYEPALHKIGVYVQRHPADANALFQYARARERVPSPNQANLSDTLSLLRRVLDKDPRNADASDELLNLYVRVGMNTEALELATKRMSSNPGDVVALHARATVLVRLRRFDDGEALKAAMAYSAAAPDDLEGSVVVLDVMRAMDRPAERLNEWAQALRTQRGETGRTLLLSGLASAFANDGEAARRWTLRAAAIELSDPKEIELLCRECDALGLFDEATRDLDAFVARAPSTKSRAMLAERLYQQGKFDQVVQRTSIEGVETDPQIRFLRTLSIWNGGDKSRAMADLDKWSVGNPQGAEGAWCELARGLINADADTGPSDATVLRATRTLLADEPENAYAQFFEGDCLLRIGEVDAGMEAINRALASAPAWLEPSIRIAQVAVALGRYDDAERLVQAVLRRSPDNVDALTTYASSLSSRVKPGDAATVDQVMELLGKIDILRPDGRSLATRVDALSASGGRDQAIAAARSAMTVQPPPSAAALRQLIVVSQKYNLGIEQDLVGRYEQLYGPNAELSLLLASAALRAGKPAAEGLAVIDAGAKKSNGEATSWSVVRARYLELANDPAAAPAWIAVAKANPDDIRTQWLALTSNALKGNHDYRGTILDQIGALTGTDGSEWRLTRAQWLLEGHDYDSDVKAGVLLEALVRSDPNLVTARLLFADCLMRLKQDSGAIDQLTAVVALQPTATPVLLQLGQLLEQRGDHARARVFLHDIVDNPHVSPQDLRAASVMLARSGDVNGALSAMGQPALAADAAADAPARTLFMAQLYFLNGEPSRVDELVPELLKAPTVESISFLADYYAASNRKAEASQMLDRLAGLAGDPAAKLLARARYESRFGDPNAAVRALLEATASDPKNAAAWKQLIYAQVRQGNLTDATQSANSAAKNASEPAGFNAFARQAPAAAALRANWPEAVAMALELIDSPQDEVACTRTLDAFASMDRQAPPASAAVTAMSVSKLAANFNHSAGLQKAVVRLLSLAGNAGEAATVACRASESAPADASLAQLATAACTAAGRWDDAITYASRWGQAMPEARVQCDVAIANARINLGSTAQAREQLTPHLAAATRDPEAYAPVLVTMAEVELRDGHADAAASLLRDHLPSSPQWRYAWTQLAAGQAPNRALGLSWLDEVRKVPAPTTANEQMVYAQAYMTLAGRFGNHADVVTARTIGEHAGSLPDASSSVITSEGQLCEADNDPKAAEAFYRQAIAADPNQSLARNNLASLLSTENRNISEALALAEAACKDQGNPSHVDFLDTLATLQAQAGQPGEAANTMDRAATESPTRAELRAKQIRWLAAAGDREGARAALVQLMRRQSDLDALPDALRAEVTQLQQTLR